MYSKPICALDIARRTDSAIWFPTSRIEKAAQRSPTSSRARVSIPV